MKKTKKVCRLLVAMLIVCFCVLSTKCYTKAEELENLEEESQSVEAAGGSIPIDAAHFPDAQFRRYLQEKCDPDGDGYVNVAEVTEILTGGYYDGDVQDFYGIKSYKGIEYFTELKRLRIGASKLESLDVSRNTKLEALTCMECGLKSLDVSKNTNLKALNVCGNELTRLDLSSNNKLVLLVCPGNKISSLDLSHVPELRFLNANHNDLTSLDLSACKKIVYLDVDYNWMESFDIGYPTYYLLGDVTFCYDMTDPPTKPRENDRRYTYYTDRYVAPFLDVSYHTHIQTYGDSQGVKRNGAMAGTSGKSKRLENIWIKVTGDSELGIQYTTHCQSYGWLPWTSNGEINGTSGESKRLEAIKIQLTGEAKRHYDVYYRVHAQTYGWLGWAKNGAPAGTAGLSKRLEGIQIVVLLKSTPAPRDNYAGVNAAGAPYGNRAFIAKTAGEIVIPGSASTPNVMYKTHVQTYGWQGWKTNGAMSGTTGERKRLEGINIKLANCDYEGGIQYRTHVQTYGWEKDWKSNGAMSGTSGQSKRLEAIQIRLTGEMAAHYDVYYRVHAQTYGWLGWAKNGAEAGTAGLSKRLEGIQIVLVPKGAAAPAVNYGGVVSTNQVSYITR